MTKVVHKSISQGFILLQDHGLTDFLYFLHILSKIVQLHRQLIDLSFKGETLR